MTTDSWLQPHLVTVLRNGIEVLRSWRKQDNLQGRIKSLENWVLVQLNHQLISSGFARVVLTNGFFKDGEDASAIKRVQAADIPGLRGRKSKVTNISADLSVRPASDPHSRAYLIAELKTCMAAGELLDDLRLLRYYRDEGIATSAELGWVVILPEDKKKRISCEKTVDRICTRLRNEAGGGDVTGTAIEEWLTAYVVVPSATRPPNIGLQPTAAGEIMSRRG